jgi:hypothetical protein
MVLALGLILPSAHAAEGGNLSIVGIPGTISCPSGGSISDNLFVEAGEEDGKIVGAGGWTIAPGSPPFFISSDAFATSLRFHGEHSFVITGTIFDMNPCGLTTSGITATISGLCGTSGSATYKDSAGASGTFSGPITCQRITGR